MLSLTNALLGIAFEHVPGCVFDDLEATWRRVHDRRQHHRMRTIPHLLLLLAPLRLVAGLVGAQRFVDAWTWILRVFRRDGLRPHGLTPVRSRVRLEHRRRRCARRWTRCRDAFRSRAVDRGAPTPRPCPKPVVSEVQPERPVTEHPATPVDNSPGAQAVRDTVVGVSDAVGRDQSVPGVLRTVTGHESRPSEAAA